MSDQILDLQCGDLFDVLPQYPDNFFDACVTDPPYGIGFMGREWDTFKPGAESKRIVANTQHGSDNPNLKGRTRGPASSPSAVEYDRSLKGQLVFEAWVESWAAQVFRVLKPGAHCVVFGAPRSHHRMMSGLENAGFEIRDCLAWMFGQGFPKSLNLHDDWEGWGTALKPAFEPIALARKPVEGTLTANVAKWGTGALNIDGCRVPYTDDADMEQARVPQPQFDSPTGKIYNFKAGEGRNGEMFDPSKGRWPANLILDVEAGAQLDAQTGQLKSGERKASHVRRSEKTQNTYARNWGGDGDSAYGADIPGSAGGASRFFYCPKVSKAEREFGCSALPPRTAGNMTGGRQEGSAGLDNPRAGAGRNTGARNFHPTVKPVELMRWLVRLVTPPGGLVLDPFLGSGTTGMACRYEHAGFIGIEREADYMEIALNRVYAVEPDGAAAA